MSFLKNPELREHGSLIRYFVAKRGRKDGLRGTALTKFVEEQYGMWVVCDRFYDSTMAYQGYGLGADREMIAALTRLVGVHPDLTHRAGRVGGGGDRAAAPAGDGCGSV